MSSISITNPYAKAFLEESRQKGVFARVAKDMEAIHKTIASSRELQLVLASPVIKSEKKVSILQAIFKTAVCEDTFLFIEFVVRKNRENFLYKIAERFLELRDESLGIINVTLTSSEELAEEQKEKLRLKVEERLNKQARFYYVTDKKLIGGFVMRIGDTVIDSSLKRQLELLREQFISGNLN
jgi:F-type H+-transporting ATPase subunit delta